MKRTLILLTVVTLFTACSNKYSVKLPNGGIVQAIDNFERDFKAGDTVCVVSNTVSNTWFIDGTGVMVNNSEYHERTLRDSSILAYVKEYRIGVVLR